MRKLYAIVLVLPVLFAEAQIPVPSAGTPVVTTFDGFLGTGFANPPSAGQLSSIDWNFSGASTSYTYGGANTSGDYARGPTAGTGIGTGGIYSYATATDTAMWFQPGGSDFTPGTVTAYYVNNTGLDITSLDIAYDAIILNDQGRGNEFNFSYSTDNVNFIAVPALDLISDSTADGSLTIQPRSATLSPVTVLPGALFYLRWELDDFSGGGSRDEFGLDNVSVTATTGTASPTLSFVGSSVTVNEDTTSVQLEVTIDIMSPNATTVDLSVNVASTAALVSDFTGSPNTLTFPANSTASQFITISIVNDGSPEGTEQAIIDLVNPTNGANIFNGQFTVTILDDDNIEISFVGNIGSVNENAGSATIDVAISNPQGLATNVDVVVKANTGTADSGADYTYPNTTLNFTGAAVETLSVSATILDESLFEGDETVVFCLANGTNGALLLGGEFTLSILNDDNGPSGPCAELFFSEYIEGSGSNKFLEIYNPTTSTVDLSEYSVFRSNNGGTSSSTFNLSGMLASDEVFVIGNASADSVALLQADVTSTITFYNGNDALELRHFGSVVDIVGVVGQDSVWVVDTGTTKEYTLVRKSAVDEGNLDWTASAANEWTAYSQNTFSFLGDHASDNCGTSCAVPGGLNATPTLTTSLLDWNQAFGALGYELRGGQVGAGGVTSIIIAGGSNSQLNAANLDAETEYWWQVRSICAPDLTGSAFSAMDTFSTDTCVAPDSLWTSNIAASSATLNWHVVPGALGYRIVGRPLGSGSVTSITVSGGATSSFPASGLSSTTFYEWGVQTFCNVGPTVLSVLTPSFIFQTLSQVEKSAVIADEGLTVYPNPSAGELAIRLQSSNAEVQVLDLLGRVVWQQQDVRSSGPLSIDTRNWESGTYQIRAFDGTKMMSTRWVKM